MPYKHPKFVRPNLSQKKRVKVRWRKPHGIDSKQRQKIKWAGAVVNKGYRSKFEKRDFHPQGKKEIFIRNEKEFEQQKGSLQNFVIRLQSTLSKRNKEAIRKKAAALNIKVLN